MAMLSSMNWLAAGEIYSQDNDAENIVFARKPQTAIAGDHFLLLSGARDYGIIIVDLRTGIVVLHQLELAGETVGVLVHAHCAFVVTARQVLVYCLVEHDSFLRLLPMPALVTPSSNTKHFTGTSALDASESVIYMKMSDGTTYDVFAINFFRATYELLHSGAESHPKAITHIFSKEERVLAVQGTVGVVCDVRTPARTFYKLHGDVHSISAGENFMVTSPTHGQSVVVWSSDASRNDQYEISLRQLFPDGQDAVVHLHRRQLIVVHGSIGLAHVFEVTKFGEQPSDIVKIMRENALHDHIERNICRRIESVETQSVQQIANTFIGNVGSDEDFVVTEKVLLPVAKKMKMSIFEFNDEPRSFFELLDPYHQSSGLFETTNIYVS